MKKLKLDVEELAVISFELQSDKDADRGTVNAHEDTNLCSYTCTDPLSAIYRYYRRLMTTG